MGAPPPALRPAHRRDGRTRLAVAVLLGVFLSVGAVGLSGCSDGLPDKGTVVGTVVDGAATPRKGCSVTRAVQGTNPYPFTDEAAGTDRDGTFRWDMYPGAYLITAVCAGSEGELRGISTAVDVSSGADTSVTVTVK